MINNLLFHRRRSHRAKSESGVIWSRSQKPPERLQHAARQIHCPGMCQQYRLAWRLSLVLFSGLLCWGARPCAAAEGAAIQPPDSSLNLKLQAPIKSWDEAIPLGNGAMGV